jgi:hypothetical protein
MMPRLPRPSGRNLENEIMANVDKSRAVAVKEYVNAAGTACEIEAATGVYYKSLADDKETSYQIPGAAAGTPQTMAAAFGLSTKFTHLASGNRQAKAKNQEAAESDVDAINDWLQLVATGTWADASVTAGRGIDQEVLLAAINEVKPFRDPAHREAVAQKIADEADYRATMRKHGAIAPIYDKLLRVKRPVVDEDLDSLLG